MERLLKDLSGLFLCLNSYFQFSPYPFFQKGFGWICKKYQGYIKSMND